MKPLTFAIPVLAMLLSACSTPRSPADELPGRVAHDRIERDTKTCTELNGPVRHDHGFAFEIARDCDTALDQIKNPKMDLDTFDVARAYLDAMADYAQTIRLIMDQNEDPTPHSDFGAYLIGRTTGLTGPMRDWRKENGLMIHPEIFTPDGQKMVEKAAGSNRVL